MLLLTVPTILWVNFVFFYTYQENLQMFNIVNFLKDIDEKKLSNRIYLCLFYVRRILIALCAFFLTAHPAFQIIVTYLLSLLSAVTVLYLRPYYFSFMNNLEIFNEVCVLFLSTLFLAFTGVIESLSAINTIGNIYISVLALQVAVNFLV